MKKQNEKRHAVDLRLEGYSLSYISGKMGVSRATLSHWLRDIAYSPNEFTTANVKKARIASAVSKNRNRRDAITRIKRVAATELGTTTNRDWLLLGLGLFAKTGRASPSHRTNTSGSFGGGANERIELSTGDAKMGRLFILWLTKGLNIPEKHIFGQLVLSSGTDPKFSKQFWSESLKIPIGHISTTLLQDRSLSTNARITGNPRFSGAPFGSIKIYLKAEGRTDLGVQLFRKVQGMLDSLVT
ncbi:MAG: hypothetical protein RIT04_402 [Candidatus Parcubacteria bacterium]|jgi:transcriptional regulator with XRE-family HTH domain